MNYMLSFTIVLYVFMLLISIISFQFEELFQHFL